jgi:hypothetical protein
VLAERHFESQEISKDMECIYIHTHTHIYIYIYMPYLTCRCDCDCVSDVRLTTTDRTLACQTRQVNYVFINFKFRKFPQFKTALTNHSNTSLFIIKSYMFRFMGTDRGSTVVKVLRYKSEGRWFVPRWCHGIFH